MIMIHNVQVQKSIKVMLECKESLSFNAGHSLQQPAFYHGKFRQNIILAN